MSIPNDKLKKILKKLNSESFLAMGFSSPNPPVAAIITDLNFEILASGHTNLDGKNHAEREVYQKFDKKIDHYLFVTLEPCTHFGRTPPCFELIQKFKPKKVFIGIKDPNPKVREIQIEVELKKLEIEYIYLNEIKKISEIYLKGFTKRIEKKIPKLIYKMALSKEGFYSIKNKSRIQISNSFSNQYTNLLRSKVDAIIVGPKTVFCDSPNLNLKKLEIEKNFKANSIYYKEFFKKKNYKFLETNFLNLIPFRIFFISAKLGYKKEFLEKQKRINQLENNKKAVFIVQGKKNQKKNYLKELESLSDFPINYIEEKINLKETILRIFRELKLNTVLVEGGNFFYNLFENDFEELIEIHSQKKILKGEKPKFNKSNLALTEEIKIGSDIWKIYSH